MPKTVPIHLSSQKPTSRSQQHETEVESLLGDMSRTRGGVRTGRERTPPDFALMRRGSSRRRGASKRSEHRRWIEPSVPKRIGSESVGRRRREAKNRRSKWDPRKANRNGAGVARERRMAPDGVKLGQCRGLSEAERKGTGRFGN